jgi:hypothetical protein
VKNYQKTVPDAPDTVGLTVPEQVSVTPSLSLAEQDQKPPEKWGNLTTARPPRAGTCGVRRCAPTRG